MKLLRENMDYVINDDKITDELNNNFAGSLSCLLPSTHGCSKYLSIKNEATNVWHKNTDVYFYILGLRKGFFFHPKMILIQHIILNFTYQKFTNNIYRERVNWEKLIANCITD